MDLKQLAVQKHALLYEVH